MEGFINEVEKITRGFSIEFEQTDLMNAIYGKRKETFSDKDFAIKYMEFVKKYKSARSETISEEKAFEKMFKSGELDVEEMQLVKRRLDMICKEKEDDGRE